MGRDNQQFSVLMSVYFKENPIYLEQALESVYNQTLLPSEVVLVEDGPLNEFLEKVIHKYKVKYGSKFVIKKIKDNSGLGKALNEGIKVCSNEIIFRMDTDDYSLNNRFELQMKVLEDGEYDIVGTCVTEYEEEMKKIWAIKNVPLTDIEIRKEIKKRNPFNHMSVAYKKSSVINAGGYINMPYFEDYYLWSRMIKQGCKCCNLKETLVNVRSGSSMIRRRGGINYIKCIINFEKKLLELDIINIFEFCLNCTIRIGVSLVPINIRQFFYKNILRKE